MHRFVSSAAYVSCCYTLARLQKPVSAFRYVWELKPPLMFSFVPSRLCECNWLPHAERRLLVGGTQVCEWWWRLCR